LHLILCAIGFTPALVYEKRRATWDIAGAEVVVDELSFGLFVEIEAEEKAILEIEKAIGLHDAEAEMASYRNSPRSTESNAAASLKRFQKPLP
jgi:adenylate cyclase class IV